MPTNIDIINIIKPLLPETLSSVLDIGCGQLWPPYTEKEQDILGSLFSGKMITAIDGCDHVINWREQNGPVGNYILGTIPDILKTVDKHDVVICHHVLEHLSKEDQDKTIKYIETLATKMIIIGGPEGYHCNDEHMINTKNPFEKHLDPIFSDDFQQKGYKIWKIHPVFLAIKYV